LKQPTNSALIDSRGGSETRGKQIVDDEAHPSASTFPQKLTSDNRLGDIIAFSRCSSRSCSSSAGPAAPR